MVQIPGCIILYQTRGRYFSKRSVIWKGKDALVNCVFRSHCVRQILKMPIVLESDLMTRKVNRVLAQEIKQCSVESVE